VSDSGGVGPEPALAFLRLAGEPVRWQLLRELARSDRHVRELTGLTGKPQNLVSYHLAKLRAAGLVSARRSSADRRDAYYTVDLDRFGALLAATGQALHPGLRLDPSRAARQPGAPVTLLFLCTGNSGRSQIAEALAAARSDGRARAFSAGSRPKPVPASTARVLRELGVDPGELRSKHLDSFAAEQFDYVITLCDRVREVCPEFPGHPGYIHWSIPDPAASGDDDQAVLAAFRQVAAELDRRVSYLLAGIGARAVRAA
jgi:protein-tyrosine-phosphatase